MKQTAIGTPLSHSATKVMLLGIAFTGVDEALCVPESDVRLFGKPESFQRRRMGVALANGRDTDEARARAKLAASKVIPVKG